MVVDWSIYSNNKTWGLLFYICFAFFFIVYECFSTIVPGIIIYV